MLYTPTSQDDGALTLAGLAALAEEAERYLAVCETFAREQCDPHQAVRARARLQRMRDADARAAHEAAAARCQACGSPTAWPVEVCSRCAPERLREAQRAQRDAERERRLERAIGPFRFATCEHHRGPCPDECPVLAARLRAAGLRKESEQ